MKFKSILATALAAVVALSSCSKDENGTDTPDGGDGNAKFSVSFILPTNVGTRGYEDDESVTEGKEGDINQIEVFAYSSGGVGYGSFDLEDDFGSGVAVDGGIKYTLDKEKAVDVFAGTNTIYVGINTGIGKVTEAVLVSKIASLSVLTDGDDAGFVMFSEAVEEELLSTDTDDDSNLNADGEYVNAVTSSIDVVRVAAKVVVTRSGTADLANDFFDDASTPVTLTYSLKKFGIFQAPTNSYIAPRFDDEGEYVTYSTIGAFDAGGITQDIALRTAAMNTWKPTYTTENRPATATFGNASYAYIQTTVNVSRSAVLNEDGDGIEWAETAAPFGNGTGNVHVFIYEGETYLADDTNMETIEDALGDDIDSWYTYYGGYVYFRVWLGTGENEYQIARNQFMNIIVGSVNAGLGEFPGYPGSYPDGEEPTDPNDKEDPNNPDPKDPDDEIEKEAALLQVEITVKNWNYDEVETGLK